MMTRRSFLRGALCALAVSLWGAADDGALLRREFVFADAPFPRCHAATLTQAPDGRLICAWFGGTREKAPDSGIWMAQFQNGKWSEPLEFANGLLPSGKRYAAWNPVLFTDGDGVVWCFYRLGDSPRAWHGYFRRSRDGGETWEPQCAFPAGIMGAVRNPLLQLKGGRLVLPTSWEFHSAFWWRPHFELSDDGGETWRKVAVDNGEFSAVQPAVFAHEDGVLQAIFRTRQMRLATSFSKDRGETWSPLEPLDVPNPNAGIAAIALKDGRFLMAHNLGTDNRRTLALSISKDGRNWSPALYLRTGDRADEEYSYPTLLQTADGLVHVVYTYNRERIAHDVVNPALLP